VSTHLGQVVPSAVGSANSLPRQVYIEFSSQAAATAAKQYIDTTDTIKDAKRPMASYFHGPHNPYKTLPKDNARRNETRGGSDRTANVPSTTFGAHNNNFAGNTNYRGGRGNYNNNRGGGMNMGYNRGGFQGNMNPMANMGAANVMPYGNMNAGFNNFNRGGMMGAGMRGGMPPNRGRGGMVGGPTPGMMGPMGGMNMGNMAMGGMGMPGGMMGMGGTFIP
jgi:hypothetical protein